MKRHFSMGVYALALIFIIGLWLVASPFVLQTQPSGSTWISSTINTVASGGVLIVVSLVGIGAYYLLGLSSAIREEVVSSATEEQRQRREEAA